MTRVFTGVLLACIASASFAQSTITFNVDFHTVYAASGNFAPTLAATGPGPFNDTQPVPITNLTGQVSITAKASSTEIEPTGPNFITLNGSWTSESGWEPANTWSTWTYNNATYDLGSGGGFLATDLASGVDWPMQAATSDVDGLLSDYGVNASPCPVPFFGCLSANPGVFFEGGPTASTTGTAIYDTGAGAAIYPGFGGTGDYHLLTGGSSTSTVNSTGDPVSSGLSTAAGIDAFVLDILLLGGTEPQEGGTVRFLTFAESGETAYMVEGTIVAIPVPAAVWLFGSALGLLGWARRRAAT